MGAGLVLATGGGALPASAGGDVIPVYVVPLDDFPEAMSAKIAQVLTMLLRIRVQASMRLPPLPVSALPGTRQLAGEPLPPPEPARDSAATIAV